MLEASDRAAMASHARSVVADLSGRSIVGVAVTWVDTSGVTRVKAVPIAHLATAAAWGIGASPSFDAFLSDDSMSRGRFAGGPVGDLRLHPDLSRITVLAAQPGWAWAPADRYRQDGHQYPMDARMLARRETLRLAELGLTVRAAFEVEWCVSRYVESGFEPVRAGPGYAMTRFIDVSDYLAEVLGVLANQGLVVEQIHPESGAGQYEVSVACEDPVGAADTFVLVRETIRAITARRGLRATFAPKVVPDAVGNGAHVHLSLWQGGVNLMAKGREPHRLTPVGEAFVAGILCRLPALLALCAPSVASYLRLVPSRWAGAYSCWGRENREAAIRLIAGPVGATATSANIEVKCVDASANPYLALAGLLAAGLAGVRNPSELPDPVDCDPAELTPEELAARGVRRFPTTLSKAVDAFAADRVLAEALGPEVVDTIVTVRRGESALFAASGPEEIIERLRWVY